MKTIEELIKSYKAVLTYSGSAGKGTLPPESFREFVRAMTSDCPILNIVRQIQSDSKIFALDSLQFSSKILFPRVHSGTPATPSAPTPSRNNLEMASWYADVAIEDTYMLYNIEQERFAESLQAYIAAKCGEDLEDYLINSDKSGSAPYNNCDGWLKQTETEVTVPVSGLNYPENWLEALLLAVPSQYLSRRDRWFFATSFDIENSYRNLLRTRGTALGDEVQIGNKPIAYKGIQIIVSPAMPQNVIALWHMDNLVYGVKREITIEIERQATKFETHFVAGLDAGAGVIMSAVGAKCEAIVS